MLTIKKAPDPPRALPREARPQWKKPAMSIMRVRFSIGGLEGLPGLQTTYWNGASSTPITADAVDVCARVRAFWNSFAGNMAFGTLVVGPQSVDVIDESTGTLVGQLQPGALASVSGSGATSLPSATMMLLRYNTAVIIAGRRLQGRNFIGPLGTGSNGAGNPTSTANANLLTAAAFFNTGATASALVVWHRPSGGFPNGSVSPVTGYGTATEFSVLRSRRD